MNMHQFTSTLSKNSSVRGKPKSKTSASEMLSMTGLEVGIRPVLEYGARIFNNKIIVIFLDEINSNIGQKNPLREVLCCFPWGFLTGVHFEMHSSRRKYSEMDRFANPYQHSDCLWQFHSWLEVIPTDRVPVRREHVLIYRFFGSQFSYQCSYFIYRINLWLCNLTHSWSRVCS